MTWRKCHRNRRKQLSYRFMRYWTAKVDAIGKQIPTTETEHKAVLAHCRAGYYWKEARY